jgi:selenocysteine-specific elongation factor
MSGPGDPVSRVLAWVRFSCPTPAFHYRLSPMKNIILGTAGHIDHGKSALVCALTGTDPDRLEEEKRRGITIDLGFAHLDLAPDLRVGFVDVPGHERFVKNMLAGVGGIDLVMLVIAADESIKPQTREHFDICRLLGIPKGLIVLSKSDLVDADVLQLVKEEVAQLVSGSFLAGAPVVPVSSRTGDGLEALKAELRRLCLEIHLKPPDKLLRLPIDRSFVMKGFGCVVTGTLISGVVRKDEEVELYPAGRRVRVRGIEVHNQPAEMAVAGQRTALNLAGVEAKDIRRGMMLAPPSLFETTDRMDCALTLLPGARALKNRTPVHFHCWTEEMTAEVVTLDGKEIKPGGRAFVQLRLSRPGLFLPGDRFIIRKFSPVFTIGGGVLIDNLPPKHRLADPAVQDFLSRMETGDDATRLELLVHRAGEATLDSLIARAGWAAQELQKVASDLQRTGKVFVAGQTPWWVAHADYFQRTAQSILAELTKFHQENPLLPALGREDLRGRLAFGGVQPSAPFFHALLQDLQSRGKVQVNGDSVKLGGREVQLSPEESVAKDQIKTAFERAGLSAPGISEVLGQLRIDRGRAEKLLQLLFKEKTLVKISEDVILPQLALKQLRAMLAQQKLKKNRINVTAFKDLTGLTRKHAIPLLEYLDRERITRREGDERVIL